MKNTLNVTNIFKYATSELTQDAFICWLLSYATREGREVDPHIRECAIVLMKKIFSSKGKKWKGNTNIDEIRLKYKKIDVLIKVGDYNIIIEDKIKSFSHSNQIQRYKDSLLKEGISDEDIITVYYKVEDQPEPEKNVDFEVTRELLLQIFKPFKGLIKNNIFTDYLEYLEWIDYQVHSFTSLPIDEWSNRAYIGFFSYLSNTYLKDEKKSWRYVYNESGGFIGLWWFKLINSEDLESIIREDKCLENVYIQFEDNTICVKASFEQDHQISSELKKCKLRELINYFQNKIGTEFRKKRLKVGKTSTIGYVEYNDSNWKDKLLIVERAFGRD